MGPESVFNDSQLAVIGCVAALGLCSLVVWFSFRFGSAGQTSRHIPSVEGGIQFVRPSSSTRSENSVHEKSQQAA